MLSLCGNHLLVVRNYIEICRSSSELILFSEPKSTKLNFRYFD